MQIIKLKSGTYVPGLGLVSIPVGISRSNATSKRGGGWILSYSMFPDAQFHWFSDYAWGTVGAALQACIAELQKEQRAEEITIGRRLETAERINKQLKLDSPGICYIEYELKPGYWVHRFGVSNPLTNRPHSVYIGNDNTYEDNWDKALKKARDLRHGFERDYTVRNYWSGLYNTLLSKKNTAKKRVPTPA